MYSRETLTQLRYYLDAGMAKTAIAAKLSVHPRTIHYWIANGELDCETDVPMPRRPRSRPHKLDPFKPLIQARLIASPELTAVRLLAECRAAGYTGGVTQLRAFVARIRASADLRP